MDNQKAAVLRRGRKVRAAREALAVLGLCGLSALSAIVVKDSVVRREVTPLASLSTTNVSGSTPAMRTVSLVSEAPLDLPAADPLNAEVIEAVEVIAPAVPENAITDTTIRYFNGRPMRPARTIRMKVTAYSPDEQSCGIFADGMTASLHDVTTNAGKLVAADSRVLPLGSVISVPGYDNGDMVPVLDRGGAIKGRRLDVLYPTHQQARQWGVQDLDVVVWEYADEKPACNFRAIRDSKN
jgi:3D (Asp-Asp-Asp) domain-containing protein